MKRTLLKSFSDAGRGFVRVFREERNMRIHTVAGFCAIVFAFILQFSALEYAALLITISLVISGELFNAALERYSDILKPRVSGFVEHIKDAAAAAVLVSSCMAILVAAFLYIPKVVHLFINR